MIAEQGDAQEWAGGELRNNMTKAGSGRELRDIDRPDVRAAADSPVRDSDRNSLVGCARTHV